MLEGNDTEKTEDYAMTKEEIQKVKKAIMKNILAECNIRAPVTGKPYCLWEDVERAIQETEIEEER